MSLVAYDSSDESEEEKCEDLIEKNSADRQVLPKKRETVKIVIPSLKEFKDEELDRKPEKKTFSQSGSGLFSMLPPPKNSTSSLSKPGFTPYVLSKKKETSSVSMKRNLISKGPNIPTKLDSNVHIPSKTEDLESEGSNQFSGSENLESKNVGPDFFSLNEKDNISGKTVFDELHIENIPLPEPPGSYIESNSNDVSTNNFNYGDTLLPENNASFLSDVPESTSLSNPDEPVLSEDVLIKLQGRRKEFESINIIDVKADDQLSDKNEWLIKNLTQETEHRPSKRRHDMPTQQQKRKHQITYLAFQAKEREMDLKNQWSMNSRTRRETQAKYGF